MTKEKQCHVINEPKIRDLQVLIFLTNSNCEVKFIQNSFYIFLFKNL